MRDTIGNENGVPLHPPDICKSASTGFFLLWDCSVFSRHKEENTNQADAGWWHSWHALHDLSQVPRQALLVKIPEAPRYFFALAERDAAAVRPGTPQYLVRPVAPYDRYAAQPRGAFGAASSSTTRP